MDHYILYHAPVSLYSGKARACLRWKNIAFDEVLTTAQVMKTVLLPVIGWPVIPVLGLPDGSLIQDTGDIIQAIETAHSQTSVWPASDVQRFVCALLHLYGDQWLTLPAMHYRWRYNEDWIYGEFGRTALPDATAEEQYALGKKRAQIFKGAAPLLGITPETIPGIEASYIEFLGEFPGIWKPMISSLAHGQTSPNLPFMAHFMLIFIVIPKAALL